ncbi:hypothetical protein A3768_5361 (plasmid) [Ralstonia solanacearum]|nr:hypothetical protein A3768_5361 [Ralstonia solanacearum]
MCVEGAIGRQKKPGRKTDADTVRTKKSESSHFLGESRRFFIIVFFCHILNAKKSPRRAGN